MTQCKKICLILASPGECRVYAQSRKDANSPRSVECRLRVTSFTSECEKRAIIQNKG